MCACILLFHTFSLCIINLCTSLSLPRAETFSPYPVLSHPTIHILPESLSALTSRTSSHLFSPYVRDMPSPYTYIHVRDINMSGLLYIQYFGPLFFSPLLHGVRHPWMNPLCTGSFVQLRICCRTMHFFAPHPQSLSQLLRCAMYDHPSMDGPVVHGLRRRGIWIPSSSVLCAPSIHFVCFYPSFSLSDSRNNNNRW